jgi:hypothetical protein
MDTIIELHDESPLKNLYALTQLKPKNAVFLCGKNPKCNNTKNYLKEKMPQIKIEYLSVEDNLEAVYDVLEKLKQKYGEIAIDITGGSDLELVAIGRFAQEYKIPLFQTDIKKGGFLCISNCEGVRKFQEERTAYKIEDFVRMHGGKVAGTGHIELTTIKQEDIKPVTCLWEEFIKDPSRWNRFVTFIKNKGANKNPGLDELEETYTFDKKDNEYVSMLKRFSEESCNVIQKFYMQGNKITYRFKNMLIRDCLKMEGSCLEIYVFMTALKMKCFDDVKVSTIIDWDGRESGKWEVRNEVDVMLSKGTTPVFISCKVGKIDSKSMAELDMLVRRFGGESAKGIMITADNPNPSIQNRAKEMDIEIIKGSELRGGMLDIRLKQIMNIK